MKHPKTARRVAEEGRWRWPFLVVLAATGCATNAASRESPPKGEAPTAPTATAPVLPRLLGSAATSAGANQPTAPVLAPRKLLVHIVPLGPVPADTLTSLVAGLEGHADIRAQLHPMVPLSATRKAKRPGRFLAPDMLEVLARVPDTQGGKVLGVTEVDIVAEKDGNPEWGVLGLGSIDGKSCVLSTFRMRRAWERGGADDGTVRSRLWKTAVHEVGHTLGLEHCPNKGCVMEDGHGTVATTDRETELCSSCAERYKRAIGP